MTPTEALIQELKRCLGRLTVYRVSGSDSPNRDHSAAVRATLDASRALAAWRKVGTSDANKELRR